MEYSRPENVRKNCGFFGIAVEPGGKSTLKTNLD
jgi:hypothetical protein